MVGIRLTIIAETTRLATGGQIVDLASVSYPFRMSGLATDLLDYIDGRCANLHALRERYRRHGAAADVGTETLKALKLAQQALNTAPRFRVPSADTDSYKIAPVVGRCRLCRKHVGVDPKTLINRFGSAAYQAAMPSVRSMKRACPTISLFASHRIWPFRMMFIASYPAMVLGASSTDRNHWLATTRIFTKR